MRAQPELADRPTLDHLALASRRSWDNLDRYCRQLGARWLGGPEPGADFGQAFYFCQVGFANGTKLEFIEPNGSPDSAFIQRFLHRNGPGPHHLTFKTSDIEAAMDRADDAGYQIVNADLSRQDWKEAFLHPKESHGIVVQLAQQGEGAGWDDPTPLPPTDQGDSATIDRVTHCVADLDRAVELFVGVLGMEPDGQAVDQRMGSAVNLRSGPWRLRLVKPETDGPRDWMGVRPGRILQVEMSVADPSAVDGVIREPAFWYLAPDRNLGTRLLISEISAISEDDAVDEEAS